MSVPRRRSLNCSTGRVWRRRSAAFSAPARGRGSGRRRSRPRRGSARGASAVIAQPLLAQPRQRLAVGFVPLRLPQHVAIPVQTVVVKLAQDGIGGAGDFARRVDIFNTNTPDTLVRAGLQVAAERGDQRAEVEFAGGEGRSALYSVSQSWYGQQNQAGETPARE